ncbi:MAG: hypothetical protein L3J61_03920, partial [Ghiorsea sp.]|nr:hypothetical protein [Ghiorsea sp.]
RMVTVSAISTIVFAIIVMAVAGPLIDDKDGVSIIALQLSFSKEAGESIISTWSIEAFNKWIVMDYLYALSYMTFFASLILYIEKRKGITHSLYPYIAITAGIFDWIENSLELWFLHDTSGFPATLFFIHSILATLKWLAVPIILWYFVKLFRTQKVQQL